MSEYKSIVVALEAAGLEEADFSFVKRRGKVHIKHAGGKEFVFFRRRETVLDDRGQWAQKVTYDLHEPLYNEPFPNWEAVLVIFERWLEKL